METRALKVGQLAERTGLSVRTLHFYDEIGLLCPAARTPSGHRLYGPDEFIRLQQIASLRELGFSLDKIRAVFEAEGLSAETVLEAHISELNQQIGRQSWLRDRLQAILQRLEKSETFPAEEILNALEEMNQVSRHFTPEQLDQLQRRRETVGEKRIQEVQGEWQELFKHYEQALDSSTDPGSESVQVLARKSMSLIKEFSGGAAGIERSVAAKYREEGASNVMRQHGWKVDQRVFDYMSRAMATLKARRDQAE